MAVEKECVGTVIDFLTAEVPQVEALRTFKTFKVNLGFDEAKLDSMSC